MTSLRKLAPQIAAHARMRDRNQRFGALAQGPAPQVHGAVLGDDLVHMAAGGDDAGAWP